MPTIYLPHIEYRLITQLGEISLEMIENCVYYEYIKNAMNESESKKKDSWYITTRNSYQTVIIGNWCKLFGSEFKIINGKKYGEPTHYFQLMFSTFLLKHLEKLEINTTKQLEEKLLLGTSLSKQEFNEYQINTKKYRNKYSTHREHNPFDIKQGDMLHPKIEPAFETCKALYDILLQVLNKLSTKIDINWMCDIRLLPENARISEKLLKDSIEKKGEEIYIIKKEDGSFEIIFRNIKSSKLDKKILQTGEILNLLNTLNFDKKILSKKIHNEIYETINGFINYHGGHTNIYSIDYPNLNITDIISHFKKSISHWI